MSADREGMDGTVRSQPHTLLVEHTIRAATSCSALGTTAEDLSRRDGKTTWVCGCG